MTQSKTSERVKLMKEHFLEYRLSGKSIAEIAKIFKVSIWSIYDNLESIAKNNNMTRDELLYQSHKNHPVSSSSKTVQKTKEHISPKELQKSFSDMLIIADDIIKKIDEELKYFE